ncbi:hypothetical protein [Pluralibacter sp.]|jgi:hypothetical protein|uniref:hypothetical protein n=1 Tax=Pluralibacter sp. TaxID=1920032 RepID=UPI0025D0B5D8|nr:hypothetical protein [Pluralibacter sp.]MBV8045273.1 hypothetical protein [Pluralibacter sp.]
MKIPNFFRPAQVGNISQETKDNIEKSTSKLIQSLNRIGNVVEPKGSKIMGMHDKAESYARQLAKSANKGNLNATLKNVLKLDKHSEKFFNCAGSPFTREDIHNARAVNQKLTVLVAQAVALRSQRS